MKRHATKIVGVLVLLVMYGFARLPELPSSERLLLASQFDFEKVLLPELPARIEPRIVRTVHPSFDRISCWVSATGAAVALDDLDQDGLPNDLCSVDPRSNEVVVAPVPGTGERYAPFYLEPAPVAFDHEVMAPIGCVPGDFNEDGLRDLLVYYWGRSPVAFLRRGADEVAAVEEAAVEVAAVAEEVTAEEVTEDVAETTALSLSLYRPVSILAEDEVWNSNALTQADVDGDGHLDLVIGNYFRDGDPVLDGTGEGILQMQDSMSRAFNGGRNMVLLWKSATAGSEPSVLFEEVEGLFSPEVAGGWALSAGAADLDGDMLPELFYGNDFGPDRLLHNRSTPGQVQLALVEGEKTLTVPSSKVLGRDSFKGMGVDFADINADGWLDIYVSNIAQEYALEESHQLFLSTGETQRFSEETVAPYVNRSEPLGLSRSAFSWEARLADFNNDGVPEAMQATGFVKGEVDRWPELQELAMGNDKTIHDPRSWPEFQPGADLSGHFHNPFFVRSGSGRYFDLADEVGIGEVQVSRGIAVADVDGDGDLDFAVANQWESSWFYRNQSPEPGSFLGLHVVLPVAAESGVRSFNGHPANLLVRPAIGASATVHMPDGRRLVSQVDGGNGHSGVRSPELHFGLGDHQADQPLQVDLRWRDAEGNVREVRSMAPKGKNLRVAALARFATAITVFNILGHFWLGFEQAWAHPLVAVAAAYFVELLLESLEAWREGRPTRFSGGIGNFVVFLLTAHNTGMAISMLLYSNTTLAPIVFAAGVAIASKYIFRVQMGKRLGHFLNPSNFGITVTLLVLPWVGIAMPYMFTENLTGKGNYILPLVMICAGSFLNTVYTKKIPLILAWLSAFALQGLIRSVLFDTPLTAALLPMTGVAFILFTFYMVSDPSTTPRTTRGQVAFGASVAAVYGLLLVGHIVFTLFFALTIVCFVRGGAQLVENLLAARRESALPRTVTVEVPAAAVASSAKREAVT